MSSYVEHVNITVNDVGRTIEFLATAVPDFKLRHRQEEPDRTWAHFGSDDSYIALTSWKEPSTDRPHGLNHIGMVVEDIEAVQKRLLDAGYPRGFENGEIVRHPHRLRLYFLDHDRNEYEFVQYLSDRPAERNSYTD